MKQTILLAILDGVAMASISFLVAVGLSLIFGIMRILSIAHGSFYAIGAYTAAALGMWLGGPEASLLTYPILLVAALMVGISLGAVIEHGLLRHIYHKEHSLQILITFGIFMVLEDLQKLVFGVEPYFYDTPLIALGMIEIGGIYYTVYQLFVLPIMAVLVMLALTFFFNRTRKGKIISAVIEDSETAMNMGVNTRKVYFTTFIVGAVLAALGGSLASATTSVVPGIGADAIVLSFAIVASAGLGHFQGAAVTSLLIGLAYSFSVHFFNELSSATPYIVMMVILLIKPYGLFGQAEVKRV